MTLVAITIESLVQRWLGAVEESLKEYTILKSFDASSVRNGG